MIRVTEDTSVAASTETISGSKRTLLKAGWVAPVIMVVSIPLSSFDANASGKDDKKDKNKG